MVQILTTWVKMAPVNKTWTRFAKIGAIMAWAILTWIRITSRGRKFNFDDKFILYLYYLLVIKLVPNVLVRMEALYPKDQLVCKQILNNMPIFEIHSQYKH